MSSEMIEVSVLLTDTVFGLIAIMLWLRVILQLTRADFYNPISQFVWSATQPVIGPLQRLIPRWNNFDLAAILMVWIICCINILVYVAIIQFPGEINAFSVIISGAVRAFLTLVRLYLFAIFIQAILSWVNPAPTPVSTLSWTINEPLLRPVRRLLPPTSGLDFSPMIVLFVLYVIYIILT